MTTRALARALLAFAATGLLCGETVRLATWNVRNYNVCDRQVEGVFRKAYPKPESEKAALRAAIRRVNPDIIVFQEMGPRPFLEELRRDLAREGAHYPHIAQVDSADPDRTVAMLSRLPPADFCAHGDVPAGKFGPVRRGVLEVSFQTQGTPWRLFVLHLKSRISTDNGDPGAARQRRAEAAAIWKLVKESDAPAYVVAGDFNDNSRSAAMRAFVGDGKDFSRPRPLPAFDTRGEIWTHFFAGQELYERFDFFVCSPAMLARAVDRRAHIADFTEVLQASDHRMLWADFEFSSEK